MGKKKAAADGVPAKVPAPVSPAHGLVPENKAAAAAPAKQQQNGGSKKPAAATKAKATTPENPLLVRRTGPCADDLSCGDRCKLLLEEFGSMTVVSMIWAGVMAALRYWNAAPWQPYVALYIVTTVFAWVFNLAMVLVWPEYSITQIVLSSSTLAAQQKKKAAQKKSGKPSSAAAALASQTKLWDWTLEHPLRSFGWTLVFIYVQAVSVLDSDLVSEKQRQSFGEKISSPSLMWAFFVITFLLFLGTLSEYSCPRLFKDKKSKKHKIEKGYVLVNEDLDAEPLSDDDDVDPMEGDLNGDNELSTFEIVWKYKYYFLSLAVVFVYFGTVSNTLLIAPTDYEGTQSAMFRESWTKPSVLITMWLFTGLLALNLANRLVCPKLARRFEIVPNPKTASPLPFGTKLVMLGVMLLFFLKSPVTLFQQHSCSGSLYRYHAHESQSYQIVDKAFEDLAHRLSESAAPQYDFKTHTETAGARSSFNKAHGCVRASFRVSDRLSPPDRVGLFSELGKEYNAWVRFSSGSSLRQDDRIRDVRGMSVKLFGVSGKKLTENLLEQMNSKYHQGYGGATDELNAEVDSHDLEFSTGETFPIVDPLQYLRLSDALKEVGSTWTLLSLMFPSWNPLTWSPSLRWNLAKWYDGGNVTSPLDATYYSQTPYRFGVDGTTHAVKYKMLPCDVNTYNLTEQERLGGSYLRENMRARLSPATAKTDTCFDLFVQRQEEACRDNLDDPTHAWQSQWYQLGTLTIARQEFLARDQIAFCENIKFNPWQALPEHAPLGPINNARAISYLMGAKDRHRLNKVKPVAVTGNEVFTKSQLPNPYVGAGLVRNYEYAAYAAPFEDLPRYVKDFQTVDQFKPAKLAKLGVRVIQSTWFSSGLHILQGKTGSVKDFILNKGDSAVPEDYADLVNHAYSTAAASKSNWTVDQFWRNDVEFARQFIAGVHANWIRAVRPGVDPIPAVFQPNAEEVAAIKAITGGASIEDLVSENRLFYTDYEILEGVTMVPGRFFYIPVVLLYVDTRTNKLMPLAVQLTRNPHKHNRVFTPAVQPKGMSDDDFKKSNEYLVWLFVKMHAACSDGQVHQSISHLGKTHLTLEPIILGWHRQLASNHVLMTMMTPHFVDTLAINNLGRQTLLATGSHSDFQRVTAMGLTGTQQLMEKAHSKWDIKKSRFLNDLAERGFPEGSNALPGYLYKDFGTRIWKAMKKYVTDMLTGHYKTDAAVLADKQVQALVDELYDPDMGAVPGDKPNLNTIDELAEFVTGVMFIASAGHSVVNFGQFDYYAFVPNRPLFLTRLVPEDTTLVDMPYIMHSLPDPDVAEETIILARTLTYLEDQGLLAAYQNAAAFEPVRKINPAAFNDYTATLKIIDDEIARENARAREYYPYLQPTYIMPSISI